MNGGVALIAGLLLAVLAAAVAGSAWMWTAMGDAPMTWQGWAAMAAGVLLTLALGVGLMSLTFYSSRSGHDERAAAADPTREL